MVEIKGTYRSIMVIHTTPGTQKEQKTLIQKDKCTPMIIAALFTIARTWKQPKCPSTDKWVKKMWYTYTRVHIYIKWTITQP